MHSTVATDPDKPQSTPSVEIKLVRNLYLFILPAGVGYDKPGVTGVHGDPGDYDFPFDYDVAWAGFVLNDGTLDTVTQRLSHELVEACTDPEDDGWTIDGRSPPDDEICDVCQNTTGRVNGVQVQGYWSQRDRACVIPTASWSSWFQIQPVWRFDHTTQQVSALARNSGHVDLSVIGFENAVWSTWWEAGPGWQPWFPIQPVWKFDHSHQQVFALSRNRGHVDLFVLGFDNPAWSARWG